MPDSLQVCKAIVELTGKFSFRFLNSYKGQTSKPVCVKLPRSSFLEPWPHLERVPSLCQTRQGNSLRREMEGTLGLRALSTLLKGRGSTVLSQIRRAPGQPGRRSCFHKGSSAAVLCVYTIRLNWFQASFLYSVVHCIA